MDCMTIANGIINACKGMKLELPLTVRLEGTAAANGGVPLIAACHIGTNVEAARTALRNSGLPITPAEDLSDAAIKSVNSL